MDRRVKILSLKKNEIIIRVKKKQRNYMWSTLVVVALFFLVFATSNNILTDFRRDIVRVVSPVTPLYSDNSDAVFTSASILEKDIVSLSVPIKNAKYEILSSGEVEFSIGTYIMVTSCDSGIVTDIGTSLDGVKYISIKHNNDIQTTIENVDIIGVKLGDIVKAGQDIATAKTNSKVILKIIQNGNINKNFKIQKSKIIWEN